MSEAAKAAPSPLEAKAGLDDVSFVYDVPVTLQVQLGEATLTIGDILKCGKGSVIPLNQKVGDPFIIQLQSHALAQGEIVEVGDRLGIKITNVLKNEGESAAEAPAADAAPAAAKEVS